MQAQFESLKLPKMLLSGLLTSEGWLGFGFTYALYLKETFLKRIEGLAEVRRYNANPNRRNMLSLLVVIILVMISFHSSPNTPVRRRLKGIKERGN